MPLPIIIGGVAAVAGLTGVGTGIHGGVKLKKANDTMNLAKSKQEDAINRFKEKNKITMDIMDQIGKKELEILSSFNAFSDVIEKIQGRPKFKIYDKGGISLPEYEAEELKRISAGAGLLLGGIGGAAAGTAGGFAAAGATTSAVMALGTASTGTAISTLSGAAATNATLAALGGGSIAAGGGGMALGSMVLGGATLGVGILVGGIIFDITGITLSNKANEAYKQAVKTEREVSKVIAYLNSLTKSSRKFYNALCKVDKQYQKRLAILENIVNYDGKTDWNCFSDYEKKITENAVMLVGLLYKMCQLNLVTKSDSDEGVNLVNQEGISLSILSANEISNLLVDEM